MTLESPSCIRGTPRAENIQTDNRPVFHKDALNILMNEDIAQDAELIRHELAKSGLNIHFTRVESQDTFEAELIAHPPDVILSDHGLPAFDGFAALTVARERCPDVPFIFVTGASGEEITIEAFESGVTDYVLKSQLPRLIPAVCRALREAESKHLYKLMEADRERLIQELHEALEKTKGLDRLLSICSSCKKIRDERGHWKPLEQYFHEHTKLMFSHGYCPECFAIFRSEFEASQR